MARRRSLNRRGSRKSLNITGLDQNSELVDSRDPLWWKNIEGEMTVRQSLRSSYGNMTEPILNDDSIVSTTELNNEWWKSLDKTATDSSRRISTRRSVRVTETHTESFISEGSDESSIKKRKVALRARDKKDVGTDNFLAVLSGSNAPSNEKEKSKARSEETLASPRHRTRQNQGNNVGESEADTTVNTSNDTDVVLKSRPKPFKKRFTKVSDGFSNNAESPRVSDSSLLQHSSERQLVDKSVDNSSLMEKSPAIVSDVRDSQLMGPPKTASHRKRLSSISRKLNLSSEESESESGLQRKRLGYRKKSRKGVSMNPFDELIGADLGSQDIAGEEGDIDTRNEESTLPDLRKTNSGGGNFAVTDRLSTVEINDESGNRSRVSENQRNLVHSGFEKENSQSQQIDDASDNDDENLESPQTLVPSQRKSLAQKPGEGGETLEKEAARTSRSVRTSKRLIDKSVYDLPPRERSTTPVITDSDGGKEKSLSPGPESRRTSRLSLRSDRSATQNPPGAAGLAILSKSRTDTVRKSRGNNSRTRIFSDEDISIEDISYGEKNGNSTQQGKLDVRKSRKSLAPNKLGESTGTEVQETISTSINLRLQEHVRRSPESRPRSITGIISGKRIQQSEKFDASPDGVQPKIIDQSITTTLRLFRKNNANQSRTSNLYDKIREPEEIDDDKIPSEPEKNSNLQSQENDRKSRKSVANKARRSALNRKLSEQEESGDEREIAQETENPRLPNKSNNSNKRFTNKSQTIYESEEETNDDPEVAGESISSNLQSKENIRRTRTSVTKESRVRASSRKLPSTEESENEQEIDREIEASRLPDKSANSRGKITRSQESSEFQEETNDDPAVADESISSDLRSRGSARRSRKIVASKSRTNSQNEESFEPEESEDDEEYSQQLENSRSYEKSNNSRAGVETIEEEEIPLETNNSKPLGSQSKKSLRSSRKSLAPFNRSRHNVPSSESIHEDEPEAAEKTDPRSSNLQLGKKSRKSGKTSTRKRSFPDDDSSVEENAQEIPQKSRKSGRDKKSVTFGESVRRKTAQTIESDVNTSDADTEINYENSKTSKPKNKSRRSTKSVGTNESGQQISSVGDDSGDEAGVVQEWEPTSINRSQENAQSDVSVSEDEGENVKTTNSSLPKSRASGKSFPLVGPRKSSQQLEKISETEGDSSLKLATTLKSKSLARPSINHRNFDPDEIVDENTEETENHRGPLIGKKSINSARLSKDVLTTPKAKNSRETLFTKKQNAEISTRLNSSIFRPLAAEIASTHHSTPLRVQKNITDFFPSKFLQKSNNPPREVKTTFDKEKLKMLKEKLKEEMKERDSKSMQLEAEAKKKEINSKKRPVDAAKQKKPATSETTTKKNKVVDKAFIVNGVVYKQPRLPRPKPWVTDRLYRHLWKLMEPKYRLSTRIKSEQFIQDLAKAVTLITRRSNYESYKHELNALMKNMARLGIIRTRNDFYDFCYDFLPYDFRVKVTPIMMPGNVLTIPYDPAQLHTPLLQET